MCILLYFIQIRVLILYHNNSVFQLNRKNINKMGHLILNLYLVFYNYDILLVFVTDLIEVYQVVHQTSQSKMICYLLL